MRAEKVQLKLGRVKGNACMTMCHSNTILYYIIVSIKINYYCIILLLLILFISTIVPIQVEKNAR